MQPVLLVLPLPHHQRRGRDGLQYSVRFASFVVLTFLIFLCGLVEGEMLQRELIKVPKQETATFQQQKNSLEVIKPSELSKSTTFFTTSSSSDVGKIETPSIFERIVNAVTKFVGDSSTSRTFFIFPMLATVAPLLLAQMSGVAISILPITGFLVIPALLVPLGLTLAVYWL